MDAEDTPSRPTAETRWDAAEYARNTRHHRLRDQDFLESIQLESTMHLVDVGCGVGDFTRRLAARVPDGQVVGVDPSAPLIELAREDAPPNARFVVVAAQALTKEVPEASMDGVISRAALHWIPRADHPHVLAKMSRVLRPGGFVRLEFGGEGNIADTVRILGDLACRFGVSDLPWFFPGDREYRRLLAGAGFDASAGFVFLDRQRRSFDREAFTGWLESQVMNAYESRIDPIRHAEFRAEVGNDLDRFLDSERGWDREFVRLQVLAHKPH